MLVGLEGRGALMELFTAQGWPQRCSRLISILGVLHNSLALPGLMSDESRWCWLSEALGSRHCKHVISLDNWGGCSIFAEAERDNWRRTRE